MLDGEAELLREDRSRCVIRGGGEGDDKRVTLEAKDNHSDLKECSLVVGGVA